MRTRVPFLLVIAVLFGTLVSLFPVQVVGAFQDVPTTAVPLATVTSTPGGPIITVRADTEQSQINVRTGPGVEYEKVGVMLIGQTAPALGKTSGGKWIQIEYHGVTGGIGWVYASLVALSPGALPIVEPPAVPTPAVTNTLDPTLVARFVITPVSTRLPTYTPPAPLMVPTFQNVAPARSGGLPMGMVIIGLMAVGLFVGLFALAQSR